VNSNLFDVTGLVLSDSYAFIAAAEPDGALYRIPK
jgi:hypothetical protein